MKKFLIIAFLLVIAGCGSMKLERQWKGRTTASLTSQLGTPDQIKYDGLASKVYIYVVPEGKTSAKQEPNEPDKFQGKAKAQLFWINRKGLIIKAKEKDIQLTPNEKIDVPTSAGRDF